MPTKTPNTVTTANTPTTTTEETIVTTPTDTPTIITPYAATKLVNEALAKAGIDKKVPPQMLYNYTTARVNAGKKPLIAMSTKGGVDPRSLETWIRQYVGKQLDKATAAKAAAAE